MTLLDYLKAEAASSGVSLIRAKERFADRIGTPTITVHCWAYGTRMPLPESIRKISDATGGKVQLNDFMGRRT